MIDDDAPLTTSDRALKRRRPRKQRSAKAVVLAPKDRVWVGAAAVWIPEAWPAMYPLVGQLVSEDLSWRAGVLHWRSCRPRRIHRRAHCSWRAYGTSLAAKRERLRATASELGLLDHAEKKPTRRWYGRRQPWWN